MPGCERHLRPGSRWARRDGARLQLLRRFCGSGSARTAAIMDRRSVPCTEDVADRCGPQRYLCGGRRFDGASVQLAPSTVRFWRNWIRPRPLSAAHGTHRNECVVSAATRWGRNPGEIVTIFTRSSVDVARQNLPIASTLLWRNPRPAAWRLRALYLPGGFDDPQRSSGPIVG
jgi:hypothetical protein